MNDNNYQDYQEDQDINITDDDNEDFSDLTDTKIRTESKDLSIREFRTMHEEGDLIIRPEYQRKFLMDHKLCSRLIESVLMDVPIPVLYLAEGRDGKYSVIDGQQRLTAFISFLTGKFPDGKDFALSGLKVYENLNKKKFSELDKADQRKIQTTALRTIVIKKESDENIKFDIFERLNTGSIRLNEDELRNTIYRGSYIKLLADLENNDTFHKLVRKERARQRMIYRGMILRFFALSSSTYLNYRPSMKRFCNEELLDNQNMRPQKQDEYRERFIRVVELVKNVFGDKSFRRFVQGDEDNKNGKWNIKQLNMSLYDIQMCGFVPYNKNQVFPKIDVIREAAIKLMTENQDFIRSIEMGTSDRFQLQTRFKIWMATLDKLIGSPENEIRIFSFHIKKKLFDDDPTCQICKQRILEIDDAEVDHIIPYAKGGKTEIANAQLAHRFCNRNKGGKDIDSLYKEPSKKGHDNFYTEEEKLAIANENIKQIYFRFKQNILFIENDIDIKYTKKYIAFVYDNTNITDIHIQRKALKIWINLKKGLLTDPKHIARDVSQIGHWGNGDYEILVKSDGNFDYIMDLIKQSYSYQRH